MYLTDAGKKQMIRVIPSFRESDSRGNRIADQAPDGFLPSKDTLAGLQDTSVPNFITLPSDFYLTFIAHCLTSADNPEVEHLVNRVLSSSRDAVEVLQSSNIFAKRRQEVVPVLIKEIANDSDLPFNWYRKCQAIQALEFIINEADEMRKNGHIPPQELVELESNIKEVLPILWNYVVRNSKGMVSSDHADRDSAYFLRIQMLKTLANLNKGRSTTQILISALGVEGCFDTAVEELCKAKEDPLPVLLEALKDERPIIRQGAIHVIREIGLAAEMARGVNNEPTKAQLDAEAKTREFTDFFKWFVTSDKDEKVREEALVTLVSFEDDIDSRIERLMREMNENEHANVRYKASEMIGELLISLPWNRQRAELFDNLVDTLSEALEDGSEGRSKAVLNLSFLMSNENIREYTLSEDLILQLTSIAKDSSEIAETRCNAIDALGKIGTNENHIKTCDIVAFLDHALDYQDHAVQTAAAKALRKIATDKALHVLIKKGIRCESESARNVAHDYMTSVGDMVVATILGEKPQRLLAQRLQQNATAVAESCASTRQNTKVKMWSSALWILQAAGQVLRRCVPF